ncbi:protein HGH1 homolog [Pectinophora gossypiella]|uniref:protein HGH1 homolog n=1 Tax=Pectinophora gossypiella TaxID=13191 RepID=UPI00214ED7D8|nr:protein HGH1 homolog [Pectinophora gossypiella]
MAQDPLDEMLEFLKPESRVDLKHISLDHLLGLSGSEDGIQTLLRNDQIIQSIIELTDDKVEAIAKSALLIIVNITATAKGATEVLKHKPCNHKNIIELLIGYVLNPQKRDVDAACMILSNITRLEDELEVCIDTFIPHLNNILNAFVNVDFNKRGSDLEYLAPMFSNLSCNHRVRKWLTEENPHVPLIKLLPFCNYELSNIRRGGSVGTVRNLAFDLDLHDFLLNPNLDLLSYLLNPLMGNEEYPDEEMDSLPIALQYLPKEKKRDNDPDIRKMIIETLNKFCSKRHCRAILRDNGVYYVLREYHKWEKDPKALLACENVVDILIQKECEVGAEDLSQVDVPEDMKEKFAKMDEDYLKTVES